MIITTEQMIARNPGARESLQEWSFGQTLALLMVAQYFLNCVSYVQEWRKTPGVQLFGFFYGFYRTPPVIPMSSTYTNLNSM
jgi:hypothetical protein